MRVFILFILLSLTNFASADYVIDFNSYSPAFFEGTNNSVDFTLKNRGDEDAFSTNIQLDVGEGFSTEILNIGKIRPQQEIQGTLKFNIEEGILPGSYTMPAMFNLRDKESFEISMTFPVIINYKKPVRSKVLLNPINAEVAPNRPTKFVLTLRNYDTKDHLVSLTDHFPKSLTVEDLPNKIMIKSKSVISIEPLLKTNGALPGSSLGVFIGGAYESDGIHYASLGSGSITILKPDTSSSYLKNPPLIIAFLMIAAWVIYTIMKNIRDKTLKTKNTKKKTRK